MNSYGLAAIVMLLVFGAGTFVGYVGPIVADLPRWPRLVLVIACSYAAGFATCAIALVLRTQ